MTEMSETSGKAAVHGNAILLGEAGILILGASGAGKSSLCLALLAAAELSGLFSALIADDRVWLTRAGKHLVGRPTPGFEGLIERRGEGVISVRHETAAAIRMVIQLSSSGFPLDRSPEDSEQRFEHAGVSLPKFFVDAKGGAVVGALALCRRLVRDTKLDLGGIGNFA